MAEEPRDRADPSSDRIARSLADSWDAEPRFSLVDREAAQRPVLAYEACGPIADRLQDTSEIRQRPRLPA